MNRTLHKSKSAPCRRGLSPVTAGLILLLTSPLRAGDWPQWGGTAAKNMASPETQLPDSFVAGRRTPDGVDIPTAKNVRWAAKVGDYCSGTPSVAGGRVFIGAMIAHEGVLKCFDESSGELLWQWTAPCRGDLRADAMNFRQFPKGLGVCSTPAVDGDRLYFVDQNCVVQCLDTAGQPPQTAGEPGAAKVIWSFDMFADKAVGSRPSDACNGSPLVDGDLLYVTTSNGVDRIVERPIAEDGARKCMAPNAPTLIALDKRTGRFVARDTAPTAAGMLHGQWSSPSIGIVQGRKMIFLGGGDGACYAFEALDGVPAAPVNLKTVWRIDCNPPEYQDFGGLNRFVHYTLGDKRRPDSLNKANDGTFTGISEIIATPVFHNGCVYVAIGEDPEHGRGRGALTCIDAARAADGGPGAVVWTYKALDRSLSTVSIADGLLYVADVAGRVHCLDTESGKVNWVYDSGARVVASTLVADGKVYLPNDKHLDILAAGRTLKVLSKVSLGDPEWATPVAAGGTLFVTSRTRMWAVQTAK
jgi:outer membrane protein assembly factor BamB